MISNAFADAIPLSVLMAGNRGYVHSVVGNPDFVRHLAELGLQAGTEIEMVQPGATCILRVNGTKLCVRGDELLRVMVTPAPANMRHSA
jgi:Fe2+ transport system protein FeoA